MISIVLSHWTIISFSSCVMIFKLLHFKSFAPLRSAEISLFRIFSLFKVNEIWISSIIWPAIQIYSRFHFSIAPCCYWQGVSFFFLLCNDLLKFIFHFFNFMQCIKYKMFLFYAINCINFFFNYVRQSKIEFFPTLKKKFNHSTKFVHNWIIYRYLQTFFYTL